VLNSEIAQTGRDIFRDSLRNRNLIGCGNSLTVMQNPAASVCLPGLREQPVQGSTDINLNNATFA